MVDFDTLELLEKIERFANKLKEGKVKAFSDLKPEDNPCDFIVYDDSKGFRNSGDLQAYPIASYIFSGDIAGYEPYKGNKFCGKNYSVMLCDYEGNFSVDIEEEHGSGEPDYTITIDDSGDWGFVITKDNGILR